MIRIAAHADLWPATLHWRDVTLPAPEENLAWDIALLDEAEDDPTAGVLRVWEPNEYAVIVGRSNVIDRDVDVAACQADDVSVVRRTSGGGAVVIGPGCLCFSLVLPIPALFGQLGVSGVTKALMARLADGLTSAQAIVTVRGVSDLAVGDRKVCGNAQRWRRQAFLHHGTILYDFDLPRIARYLRHPEREPDYRAGRHHDDFVMNIPRSRSELVCALRTTWNSLDE